jgi:tRNA threonylcarbamoyl adenosine modification protein YeaZ
VVLVIDTSSVLSAVAALTPGGKVMDEAFRPSGRSMDLPALVHEVVRPGDVGRVAVATGPGSFTGLRVGAAYAVGLALGRRLPLFELHSLEIQQTRARVPAMGVVEAGRGRVYYRLPDGEEGMAEAASVPSLYPAVGWLHPLTAAALRARMLPSDELRTFGEAASRLIGTAPELGYGTVRLHYMQSFERII